MSDKKLLNQLVRLAHEKPELRPHLLPVIEKESSGLDLDRLSQRFEKEMSKVVRGAGQVVMARFLAFDQWQVVLSTEYAALKVYYHYRNTPDVRLKQAPDGWLVSKI